MKLRNFMLITVLGLFTFTACQDEKKDKDNDDDMEMNENAMEDDDMMDDDRNMDRNEDRDMEDGSEMNLAEVATEEETLSTFVDAMDRAGWVTKIESETQYTIFAPTNEAFDALPDGTVEELMKPESKEKLEDVLSYHIIPGNVDAAKLKDLIEENGGTYSLATANDGNIDAMIKDNGDIVLKDGRGKEAKLVATDIKGSNGVIHSINTVVMRK